MSTCPGLTLEDYLCDAYNISIEDDIETGGFYTSVQHSGIISNIRPEVSKELFSKLVYIYEPVRKIIENQLETFDEEEDGSWRDYKYFVIHDRIPEKIMNDAYELLNNNSEE